MTKAAEAPWAQLGITEEEFNEVQAKVNAIVNGSGSAHGANPSDAPAITRRKRSDAGTKRGPKPVAQPDAPQGVLTREQYLKLSSLARKMRQADTLFRVKEQEAQEAAEGSARAEEDYDNYLDSLTAE